MNKHGQLPPGIGMALLQDERAAAYFSRRAQAPEQAAQALQAAQNPVPTDRDAAASEPS